MTRLPFILPICIISLLSGCQDANPAEREWKDQLYKNLAIVGARNWIVIAESSFPAYTGTGIRTMVSDKTSDEGRSPRGAPDHDQLGAAQRYGGLCSRH